MYTFEKINTHFKKMNALKLFMPKNQVKGNSSLF